MMIIDWTPDLLGPDGAPPDGAYRDCPEDVYRAAPGLSKSMLSQARGAYPAEWLWRKTHPLEPTAAMTLGSMIDGLVFRGRIPEKIVIRPEGMSARSNAGKAWAEEHAGQEIAEQAQEDNACACASAVLKHPLASILVSHCDAQVAVWWTRGGVRRKGLIDGLLLADDPRWPAVRDALGLDGYDGLIHDLKSTGADRFTGRPKTIKKLTSGAADFGYHLQLAHYGDGVAATTGAVMLAYFLTFVTTTDYHPVEVVRVPETPIARGAEEMEELIAMHQACERAGKWPATLSASRPLDMHFNRWQMNQED